MSDPAPPQRGHMVLYDRMDPPLPAGDYRVEVATDVSFSGATLPNLRRYFAVEGPRFSLSPTDVAGVFPPRNAQGDFTDALPQVVLGRRTLPWERTADPAGVLTLPAPAAGGPPAVMGKPPWLALLLFDQTSSPEAVVLADQLVSAVLPHSVLGTINPPADARCQAIEVGETILRNVLPSLEELHLLAHVRQVNVEDRELSAGDSDGWFSVVVCARVPQAGRQYLACLVSLEGRTDLISTAPPAVAHQPRGPADLEPIAPFSRLEEITHRYTPGRFVAERRLKLILLYSWKFECTGSGTFQGLCERLNVGLIGEVRGEWPKVADTGHLPMPLLDRVGAEQTVWYRGPLAPFAISRDRKGPYHSADQARRISPETGMEDVSYAAAFEAGRLLAAADARLAQDLMRWRCGDYRRSVERSLGRRLRDRFPGLLERFRIDDLAAKLLERFKDPRLPVIDPLELAVLERLPGLDAARLSEAWSVPGAAAAAILATELPSTGMPTDVSTGPLFGSTTLEAVAREGEALRALADVRARAGGGALDADGRWIDMGGRP